MSPPRRRLKDTPNLVIGLPHSGHWPRSGYAASETFDFTTLVSTLGTYVELGMRALNGSSPLAGAKQFNEGEVQHPLTDAEFDRASGSYRTGNPYRLVPLIPCIMKHFDRGISQMAG